MASSPIAGLSTFEFDDQLLRRDEPEGILHDVGNILPVDLRTFSVVKEDADPVLEDPR